MEAIISAAETGFAGSLVGSNMQPSSVLLPTASWMSRSCRHTPPPPSALQKKDEGRTRVRRGPPPQRTRELRLLGERTCRRRPGAPPPAS
uniref:Uncharacterized protein n=1 Tax=Hippocampus comes TaxID=109280 RepID=A0A3Q2XT23_HIPCM